MSYPDTLPAEGPGEDQRRIGDIRQRLGLSGLFFGTDGSHRQAFIYAYAVAALFVTAINTLNVMSILHDMPHLNPLEPLIWEGSSWLTLLAFFWIVWLAWRLAPFNVRPRWLLLIHIPAALVFAFCPCRQLHRPAHLRLSGAGRALPCRPFLDAISL